MKHHPCENLKYIFERNIQITILCLSDSLELKFFSGFISTLETHSSQILQYHHRT